MPSSTVTSKGQVTLPADFRRKLGLRPGDRVHFSLEDGTIRVDPRSYADRTAGMFMGRLSRAATLKEEEQAAADYSVQQQLKKLDR